MKRGEIKIMTCSCSESAVFQCLCEDGSHFFCSNCSVIHMQDTNFLHTMTPLQREVTLNPSLFLLEKLSTERNTIRNLKIKIATESAQLHNLLDTYRKSVQASLSSLDHNIKLLLINLFPLSENSTEKSITKILSKLPSQCFPKELPKNIFTLDLLTTKLENYLSSWSTTKNNIEDLFKQKKPLIEPIISPSSFETSTINPSETHQSFTILPIQNTNSNNLTNQGKNSILTSNPSIISTYSQAPLIPTAPIYFSQSPIINSSSEIDIFENREKINPMKCLYGHNLEWSYKALIENFLIFKKIYVDCEVCKCKLCKPCWNCNMCKYYVCEDCGKSNGFTEIKILCEKGHDLRWKCNVSTVNMRLFKQNYWTCAVCKGTGNCEVWHCSLCFYSICKKCGASKGVKAIEMANSCIKGHTLNLANDKNEICSQCQSSIKGQHYTCTICPYILCKKCYRFADLPIPQLAILSCPLSHLLRWVDYRVFRCNICRSSYREGSFTCKICNFDVCSECSDYLEYINYYCIEKYDSNYHPLQYIVVNANKGQVLPKCSRCSNIFSTSCGVFACHYCKICLCIGCFRNWSEEQSKPR